MPPKLVATPDPKIHGKADTHPTGYRAQGRDSSKLYEVKPYGNGKKKWSLVSQTTQHDVSASTGGIFESKFTYVPPSSSQAPFGIFDRSHAPPPPPSPTPFSSHATPIYASPSATIQTLALSVSSQNGNVQGQGQGEQGRVKRTRRAIGQPRLLPRTSSTTNYTTINAGTTTFMDTSE